MWLWCEMLIENVNVTGACLKWKSKHQMGFLDNGHELKGD